MGDTIRNNTFLERTSLGRIDFEYKYKVDPLCVSSDQNREISEQSINANIRDTIQQGNNARV